MTPETFSKAIGQLRLQKHKQLNEIYWWVSLSLTSLDNTIKEENIDQKVVIKVPSSKLSGKGEKEITRTKEQAIQILEKAKSVDIYYSVFVFIVAQVEDFLSQLIYLILKTDNRRIKGSVQGVDLVKKFEVDEIIDAADKNEIVDKIIRQNLINLFYAGPSKQKDYFKKVLGIEIEDDLWNDWFEFKATRDIIVHNSGIINSLYIDKSGTKARGKVGESLLIDKAYFGESIALMKSLIGRCEVASRKSVSPKVPKTAANIVLPKAGLDNINLADGIGELL